MLHMSRSPVRSAAWQSKKKGFVALPALDAAEPSLPWSVAFTQRLGRHGVAKRDIVAGARFAAAEHVSPSKSASRFTAESNLVSCCRICVSRECGRDSLS